MTADLLEEFRFRVAGTDQGRAAARRTRALAQVIRSVLPERTVLGACATESVQDREVSPATEEEIRAAALQYVRKISGFAKPSLQRPLFHLGGVRL
jgi:hypothetical protein